MTSACLEYGNPLATRTLLAAVSLLALYSLTTLAWTRPLPKYLVNKPTLHLTTAWAAVFAALNLWVLAATVTCHTPIPRSPTFHSFYSVSLVATLGGTLLILHRLNCKLQNCQKRRREESADE